MKRLPALQMLEFAVIGCVDVRLRKGDEMEVDEIVKIALRHEYDDCVGELNLQALPGITHRISMRLYVDELLSSDDCNHRYRSRLSEVFLVSILRCDRFVLLTLT